MSVECFVIFCLLNLIFSVECFSRLTQRLHFSVGSIHRSVLTSSARAYSSGGFSGNSQVPVGALACIPSPVESDPESIISRLSRHAQRLFWQSPTNSCDVEPSLKNTFLLGTQETVSLKNRTGSLSNREDGSLLIDQNTNHELINKIIRAADPLYPITEEELQSILDLYTALPHRPIDGISEVLKGRVNTSKSAIYCNVLSHIVSKNSNLNKYRNAYARLSKALNGDAMNVMRQIMLNQASSQKLVPVKNDKIMESKENHDGPTNLVQSLVSKGESGVTPEEQKLLDEIYRLLPHIDPRYITRLLVSKDVRHGPTFKAITEVIQKIRKREEKSGRSRCSEINLAYFQKLHQLSSNHRQLFPAMTQASVKIDGQVISKGRYSITREEQKLLSDVYRLLPHIDPRYITRLVASKKVKSGPTLRAITEVIQKIREREEKSGRKRGEEINLDYFHKLHWSSVRVTGKSGWQKRDDVSFEN